MHMHLPSVYMLIRSLSDDPGFAYPGNDVYSIDQVLWRGSHT